MKTAPTLPAMTDEQIGSCVALADRYAAEYRRTHWNTHLARAIIAARDAQWDARLDAAVTQEMERCINVAFDYAPTDESACKIADAIRARTTSPAITSPAAPTTAPE